ncbi:MAG: prepilin-type N-terminal cleavage/methylation domain-containing protein [Sedimentisphaerales bacterium]|nr:prepilin-type N-terminal cleavage/methylation domain-containing protein [Sedimentisphaerales bacterium]
MKRYKYSYGLTLVEILVVVAIIAILATMVIGIAARIDDQSKEKSLEFTFTLLESALQEYNEFKGTFPEQQERISTNAQMHSQYLYGELDLIPESRKILERVTKSMIKNEYVPISTDTVPEIYDPWGIVIDYIYVPGDNFPELLSAGSDKIFGTADDISNQK